MKQLILEGISIVLGRKAEVGLKESSGKDLLLEFLGKAESEVIDGSAEHDRYLDRRY